MTSEQIRRLWLDANDGRIPSAVERHLSTCTACQEFVAVTKRIMDILRVEPLTAGPNGGWRAFEERLASASRAKPSVV